MIIATGIHVSLNQSTYNVTKGGIVTLVCSVSALPAASSVAWKRTIDGVESFVVIDGRTYTGSNPTKPSLTINGADTTDSGIYVCTAENSVGTAESDPMTLLVTGG